MGDYGGVLGQHTAQLAVVGVALPFTGLDLRLVVALGLLLTLAGAVLLRLTWRHGPRAHSPIAGPGYWIHLLKWAQYVTLTLVMVVLLVTAGIGQPWLFAWMLMVNVGIHLLVGARYLTARDDQSRGQRAGVYATAPLLALWTLVVLRPLRWWAMATVLRVQWGTRAGVEVRDATGDGATRSS